MRFRAKEGRETKQLNSYSVFSFIPIPRKKKFINSIYIIYIIYILFILIFFAFNADFKLLFTV